jgi:hypothetical protein
MKTKEGRIANTKGLRWKPTYRVHRRKKREAWLERSEQRGKRGKGMTQHAPVKHLLMELVR